MSCYHQMTLDFVFNSTYFNYICVILYLFQLHTDYTVLAVYELDNKTLHWQINICRLPKLFFHGSFLHLHFTLCCANTFLYEWKGRQSMILICNWKWPWQVHCQEQPSIWLASCATLVVLTQNKKAQCHYVIFPAEHFMHPHRVPILQRTALHCSGRCERLWARLTKCRLRGVESQKNVSRTAWHFRNARLVRIPFPVFHDVWKG